MDGRSGANSQVRESPQRLMRPLVRLAKLMGVSTCYTNEQGEYHEVCDGVLVATVRSLGVDGIDEADVDGSAARMYGLVHGARLRAIVPSTLVHTYGSVSRVFMHTGSRETPQVSLVLESGKSYSGQVDPSQPGGSASGRDPAGMWQVEIPADVPVGYHTLQVRVGRRSQDAVLLCAPRSVGVPSGFADPSVGEDDGSHAKPWGWSFDLHALRSGSSWGVGDYEDLKAFASRSMRCGHPDFIAPGPLGGTEPGTPISPSPYCSASRYMADFSAIRPEEIEEYALLDVDDRERIANLYAQVEHLNTDSQTLDRDTMWRSKMRALWIVYRAGRGEWRQQDFERFKIRQGRRLDEYVKWCLCADKWGMPSVAREDTWVHTYAIDGETVNALCRQFPQTVEFYRWLEWVAQGQLDEAAAQAKSAGMRLGLVAELVDVVRPAGAEVWGDPDCYAEGMRCGDGMPMNPVYLSETGYRGWRDLVHTLFAHAHVIHIPDAYGMFRQWWVPAMADGGSGNEGVYVNFESEAKLAILKIEASRANGLVVCKCGDRQEAHALAYDEMVYGGETVVSGTEGAVDEISGMISALSDCGFIVERSVECVLAESDEEQGSDGRRGGYLASVTAHAAEPLPGRLRYEALTTCEQLGLSGGAIPNRADAVSRHNAMLTELVGGGALDPRLISDEEGNEEQIVEAFYRAAVDAPCAMVSVSLPDAVGQRRSPCLPQARGMYPDWQIPLVDGHDHTVSLEELFDVPRLRSLVRNTRLR